MPSCRTSAEDYELATDVRRAERIATAFTELSMAI
jgi:hypothetical protein